VAANSILGVPFLRSIATMFKYGAVLNRTGQLLPPFALPPILALSDYRQLAKTPIFFNELSGSRLARSSHREVWINPLV
jgi:hypothetical protein